MGIDLHNLALLAHGQDNGVRFGRTIGIGRQAMFVDPPELERFRALRRLPVLAEPERPPGRPRYFEPLMEQWFGAAVVDAVDASPYEAASIVHDMNLPLAGAPGAPLAGYDAVLDFGCLEHVFNFPVAWRNCVDLCRTGGHLLHAVPANNLLGHGFYQFSPELFFNLYREENGFALQGIWIASKVDFGHWWRVADPRLLQRRVTLRNAQETYLMVIARKLLDSPPMPAPQQSDYAEQAWQGAGDGGRSGPAAMHADAGAAGGGRQALAGGLRRLGLLAAARSLRDRVSAVGAALAEPAAPDYERVVVAELLRRGPR